jgi:hypothetical protein
MNRLAAGQELRLADHRRPSTAGVAALAPALPAGLEPGRPTNALDLVGLARLARRPWLTDSYDGVGRIVGSRLDGIFPTATSAATAAAAAGAIGTLLVRRGRPGVTEDTGGGPGGCRTDLDVGRSLRRDI